MLCLSYNYHLKANFILKEKKQFSSLYNGRCTFFRGYPDINKKFQIALPVHWPEAEENQTYSIFDSMAGEWTKLSSYSSWWQVLLFVASETVLCWNLSLMWAPKIDIKSYTMNGMFYER